MVLEIFDADGLARMTYAHGVFFSRDPHLAALGLVWPPLPALTDLPLVLALKPFGAVQFSGPLMSAFFSGLAVTQLNSIFKQQGLPIVWRLGWVIAFGMHKLIIHNAATGVSEAGFLFFLLLSLNGFMSWERSGKIGGLLAAGIGAAFAFYCRYEALAWAAVMILAIAWTLWFRGQRFWRGPVEGSVMWFAIPILWMVPLWMAINWQIKGNPIFFLVGTGATSNTPDTAFMVGPSHQFAFAYGSLPGAANLIAQQVINLAPLLLPASLFLLMGIWWKRSWSHLAYFLLAWSILAFTYLIAWRGLLPPFSRYFFWAAPAGFIAAGAAYQLVRSSRVRAPMAFVVLAIALYSTVTTAYGAWQQLPGEPIEDPVGRAVASLVVPAEEASFMRPHAHLAKYKEYASYLEAQPSGTLTIADASITAPVAMFMSRPQDLILTTDKDFFPILNDPVGQADQILVAYPSFDSKGRSDILRVYPDLYEKGAAWAILVHEFSGPEPWRLYKIIE
ncbi:MAG: hypothetical protein Q7R39_14610 [Dehalococcoidia bacterium]|nr:hypothetical protein [Dehalococcoidia bacterium]